MNIPLEAVRSRMETIPKEKEVVVSCNVGRTAYFAARILMQEGYQVKILPGGWCTYSILPEKVKQQAKKEEQQA